MPTAPLVAAWQARNRGLPGTPSGTEAQTVTFPATALVSRVQIALGADLSADPLTWAWVDVTRFVRWDQGVWLTVGRRDEASTVATGKGQLKLDNRYGRFTRRNPTGPYYGLLSKNTPIWVTVDAGSGEHTRMEMFVNEWPKAWADKSANDSTVTIACAGVLRRLAQGSLAKSPLLRTIPGSNPVAYWTLEEGADALLPSALNGAGSSSVAYKHAYQPGRTPGPSGTTYVYGLTPLSSATTYNADRFTKAGVVLSVPSHAAIGVEIVTMMVRWKPFDLPNTVDNADLVDLDHRVELTGGDIASIRINLQAIKQYSGDPNSTILGSPVVTFYDAARSDLGPALLSPDAVDIIDGAWHEIQVRAVQSGADVNVYMWVDGELDFFGSDTITSKTLGTVTSVVLGGTCRYLVAAGPGPYSYEGVYEVSHISVHTDNSVGRFYEAMTGYVGEMAHDRAERLCGEEGLVFETLASTSAAMGPQGTKTLLALLRECEAVDGGTLYEKRWGLAYQALSERYNAPVELPLDIGQYQIADIPDIADDDQRTRNRWTVSRTNGSEYTAEQTTGPMGTGTEGPGLYDDAVTLNLETDDQLQQQANWRVHVGTVDEDRWPDLGLNFAHDPGLIDTWCSLKYGARTTVANPLTQMTPEPADLIIEGHSERWNSRQWNASLNCSPSSPHAVGTYQDDSVVSAGRPTRYDADHSTTNGSYVSGAASLSVATSQGPLFTTTAGHLPLQIRVYGCVLTVSVVAGSSSPQTLTISAATPAGVTIPSGTQVRVVDAGRYAL